MEMCCLATPPKLGLLKLPQVLGRAHLLLLTLVTICINHTSFPAFTLISNSSAKGRLVLFLEGGVREERKMAQSFVIFTLHHIASQARAKA